jgi:heme/copper-type cytochrome/quinol oxidase subunit 3
MCRPLRRFACDPGQIGRPLAYFLASAANPEEAQTRTILVKANNILSLLPVATGILIYSSTITAAVSHMAAVRKRE